MRYVHVALLLFFLLSTSAAMADPGESNPYERKPRASAVSLEMGGNSLSSLLGVKGTFFVQPQIAVDVGVGLSGVGLRPGVYARYLFSLAKFTPFAYGGFKYGIGTGGQSVEVEDPETEADLGIKIEPSPFLDFGMGVDYLAHNGIYFTGGIGWSMLLRDENYEWTEGEPSEEADDLAKFFYGSGLAVFLSLGYAF